MRARRLPPVVRKALAPDAPKCYRHCDRAIHPRRFRSALPGLWQVYACPGGAVSVVSYFEISKRDPTPDVGRTLRGLSAPETLVRPHDLRSARRHGPELGRAAERWLALAPPGTEVRGTYWRLYPFEDRRGIARRLFACFRHLRRGVVFFTDVATAERPRCPKCRSSRSAAPAAWRKLRSPERPALRGT